MSGGNRAATQDRSDFDGGGKKEVFKEHSHVDKYFFLKNRPLPKKGIMLFKRVAMKK